jgi:hypothetical protein
MANDTFDRDLEVPDSLNMDAITGIEQRLAELSTALKELKGQKNAIPDALNIKDSVMYANKLAELTKSVYEYKNALKDRGDFAEKDYIKETMAYVNNLTLAYKKLSDELISLETDDSKLLDSNEAVEKSVIALTEALSAIIPVKKKKAEITNEVVTATKEETKATEELNKAQSGTINITDVVAKGKKGKAKNSEEAVKATNAETSAIKKQNEALKESEKLKGSSKPAKSQAFMVDIVNDDKSKTPLDKMISAYKSQVSFTGGGLIRDYDKVKGSEEAIINFYKEQASIINRIQEVTTKAAIYVGGGIGSGKSYMLRNLAGAENFYTISKGKDSSVIAADLFGFNREGTGSSMTGVKGVKGSPGILENAAAKGGTVVIDEFFNMDAKTMTEMLDFLASGKFRSGSTGKEVDFYANGAKLITSSRYTPEEALRLGKLSPDMYSRVKDNIRFTMPDVAKDGKMSNELFHGFFNYFLNQTAQGSSNEVLQKLKGLSIDETFTKAMLPNIKSVRDVESLAKNIIGTMQADPLSFIDGDKTRLSSKTFDVKSFAEKAQLTPEFDSYEQEMIAGLKNIEAKLGSVTNAESTLKVASEGSTKALQQQDAITKAKVDSIAKLVNSLKNLSSSEEGVTKSVNTSVESMEKKKKKIQEVANITPLATAPPVVDQILNNAIKQQKPVLTGYPKRAYDVESDRTKISSLDAIIAEKTKKTNDIQESLNTMPSLIRADVKSSTDKLILNSVEKEQKIEAEFVKKLNSIKGQVTKDVLVKLRTSTNKKLEKERANLQKLITIEEINISNKYSEVISFLQDSYNKEMADLEIIKKQRDGYGKRVDKYTQSADAYIAAMPKEVEPKNIFDTSTMKSINKATGLHSRDYRYKENDLLNAEEVSLINQAKYDNINSVINQAHAQARQDEFKKEADLFEAENRKQEKINNLTSIIEEKNKLYNERIKQEQIDNDNIAKATKEFNDVLNRKNTNIDSIFNIVGRGTSNKEQLNNPMFSAFYKTGHGKEKVQPIGGIGTGDDDNANILLGNLERHMLSFRQSFGMKMFNNGMSTEFDQFDKVIDSFYAIKKTGADKIHSAEFKKFLLKYKDIFDSNIDKFTAKYGENVVKQMQGDMDSMISNLAYQKGEGNESRLFTKGPINTIFTGITPFDKRKSVSNTVQKFGSTEEEWLKQMFGMAPNTMGTSFKKTESSFLKEISGNQVKSSLGNLNNFYYRMKQLKEELPELMQLMNTTVTKVAFSFSRLAFGVQVVVMNMALLKTAFVGTFGYALTKSIEFTKSLVDQTEKMQRARITLTGVFGQEKSKEMVEFAKRYAVTSPATFEEITNMIRSFGLTPQIRNMLKEKTGDMLKTQMKDLADITVSLGISKPEQGTSGAMFSLREALAGQWRSLKMRFEIVPEAVAASIGKTVKEIEKSPELLTQAFKEFWKISMGEDTLKTLSETVKVQVNNIYDFVEQTAQKIGEAGFYKSLQTNITNIAESFSGLLDTEWIDTTAIDFSKTLVKYSNTLLNTVRDFATQVLEIKTIDNDIQASAQKRLKSGELQKEQIPDFLKNTQIIKSSIDVIKDLYIQITDYTKEMSVFALGIAKLFTDNKKTINDFIHDVGSMGKEIINMFIIAGGYYGKMFSWIANIGQGSDNLLYTITKITAAISMVFPIASANIFINAGRILIEVLTALTRRDLFIRIYDIMNKGAVAMGSFVNVLRALSGFQGIGSKIEAGAFTPLRLITSGILKGTFVRSNEEIATHSTSMIQKMQTTGTIIRGLLTTAIIGGFALGATDGTKTFAANIKTGFATVIGVIKSLFDKVFGADSFLFDMAAGIGLLGTLFPELGWLMISKTFKILTTDVKTQLTSVASVFTSSMVAGLGIIGVAFTAAIGGAWLEMFKFREADWKRGADLTTGKEMERRIANTTTGLGGYALSSPESEDILEKKANDSLFAPRKAWVRDMIKSGQNFSGLLQSKLAKRGTAEENYETVPNEDILKDSDAYKTALDIYTKSNEEFYASLKTFEDGGVATFIKNVKNHGIEDLKELREYFKETLAIDDKTAAGNEVLDKITGIFKDGYASTAASSQTGAMEEQLAFIKETDSIISSIIEKNQSRLIVETAILQNQLALNPALAAANNTIDKIANNYRQLRDIKSTISADPLIRDIGNNRQIVTQGLSQYEKYYKQTKEGKIQEIKDDRAGLERVYQDAINRYNEVKQELNSSMSLNMFQRFLNAIIDKLIDFLVRIKEIIAALNMPFGLGSLIGKPLDSAITKLNSYKSTGRTKEQREVARLENEANMASATEKVGKYRSGLDDAMKSAMGGGGGGADKQAQLAKDYANDMKKLNKEYLEATNQTTLARIQGAKDEYDASIKSYEDKYKGFKNYEELMTKAKAVELAKRAKAEREAFIDIYAKVEKNQFIESSLRMTAFEETQRYELEKELTNIQSIIKNLPQFKELGTKLAEALQEGYKQSLRDNAWKLHDETYKNLIGDTSSKLDGILKDNYFMNSLSIGQKQQASGYMATFTELDSVHKLQEMAMNYKKSMEEIERMKDPEIKNLGTTKERLKELTAITFEMQKQAEILNTQKAIQELQLRQHNDFKGAFKLGFEETVKGFESGFDVMKRGGEELANGLRSGLSDALTKTILKEADDIRAIWKALWQDLVRIVVKSLMDSVVNNLMQSFLGFGKEGKNNPVTLNRGADDAGMSLSNVANEANMLAPTFSYVEQAARAMGDAMATVAGADKFLGKGGDDIFAEFDDGEDDGGGNDFIKMVGKLLPLAGFADGGIVSAPTLAMIGEGKTNEAIVPMPNGKAIPVDLKGTKQEGAGNAVTIINVLDPSLLDAYVAQNPDAIINLVALDTLKGGKTFQAGKAKQSK